MKRTAILLVLFSPLIYGVISCTDLVEEVNESIDSQDSVDLIGLKDSIDIINDDSVDVINNDDSINVPENRQNINYSGPITITKGGTYTGNYKSENTSVSAISIQTTEKVILRNCNAKAVNTQVHIPDNGNVEIYNSYFEGMEPTETGRPHGRAISANNVKRLIVENNHFENGAGIYVHFSNPDEIRIRYNYAHNINGWHRNKEDYTFRQFIQFDKVRNLPNGDISWNYVYNEFLESKVEDVINMFKSSGTPDNPIRIHNNLIDGSWPHNYDANISGGNAGHSGGGILVGDGNDDNPDNVPHHIEAYDNTVLRTTNYGIAIASGHDLKIYNNKIISAGLTPDGEKMWTQNVGLYVWKGDDNHFFNNEAWGNLVGWDNNRGGSSRNDWWLPDCSGSCDNTSYPGENITITIEEEAKNDFFTKVNQNNIIIGIDGDIAE